MFLNYITYCVALCLNPVSLRVHFSTHFVVAVVYIQLVTESVGTCVLCAYCVIIFSPRGILNVNAFKDFSVRTVAMDAFQCSDILSDEIKPFLLMQLLGHMIRLLRGISGGERLFKNEGPVSEV